MVSKLLEYFNFTKGLVILVTNKGKRNVNQSIEAIFSKKKIYDKTILI